MTSVSSSLNPAGNAGQHEGVSMIVRSFADAVNGMVGRCNVEKRDIALDRYNDVMDAIAKAEKAGASELVINALLDLADGHRRDAEAAEAEIAKGRA